MNNDDIIEDDDLVEAFTASDSIELDDDALPAFSTWQQIVLNRQMIDMQSGVAWHVGTYQKDGIPKKPTSKDRLLEIRMELASWFLSSDNKFIKVNDPEMRLGLMDLPKVAVPMLSAHFADTPFADQAKKNAYGLVQACIETAPADPRLAFGPWSGKTYPAPGNPSPRLFRNGLWDINSWSQPAYRQHPEDPDFGPFKLFLDFAIPDEKQQAMLLDWVAWSLQHEAQKPSWALMLFSEEKGTGKSTIGVVLEALFGQANTAKLDGVDKLVAKHADRILDKKLIIAEEVQIGERSTAGNKLKDLITSERTTVEPKYQPTKTIPLKACFFLTTNHKPLWLEAGERRYYIIEITHEGHAQGPKNDEFAELVGAVMEQISEPEQLSALYAALMQRQISSTFDPKSIRFQANATPIMQDLQALSGDECDETLEALLQEFNVAIIPSSDFRLLAKYMGASSDNSLRNALARLGWEKKRPYLNKEQQRAWVRKDTAIEYGRIRSSDLAGTLEGAVKQGFEWYPLAAYMEQTWQKLLEQKLDRSLLRDRAWRPVSGPTDDPGPFIDSRSSVSYSASRQPAGRNQPSREYFLRVEDDLHGR